MNDARLNELRQKYKDRNLLEELGWGAYANHSGYTSKSNGEFLNWLCNEAYRELKKTQPEIIFCKDCKHSEHWYRDKRRCFLWHEDGIDVFEDGFCNYAERREVTE